MTIEIGMELPSQFQIGERCTLYFGKGSQIEGCKIFAIRYDKSQVWYDLEVPFDLTGRDDVIIEKGAQEGTTLLNQVRSIHVVAPGYVPTGLGPATFEDVLGFDPFDVDEENNSQKGDV